MTQFNRMRFALQLTLTAAWCAAFFSCNEAGADVYTVSGTLKNAAASSVYLEESTADASQPVVVDSAAVGKNGEYTLSTPVKEETIYSLRLGGTRFPFVSFVNDSKKITIDADFKNAESPYTIKGSEGSEALKTFLYGLGKKINDLKGIGYIGDSIGFKRSQRDSIIQAVDSQHAAAVAAIKSDASTFIASVKSAPLLLYGLGSYQSIASNPGYGLEPFTDAEVQTIIADGAQKFPQHKALAAIRQRMQAAPETPQTAAAAPDFTLPDVAGKPIALSSLRGQYVLVDFWASWCGPCREENPNVVAAYQKFKDKNFTILGVSLDKEKAPWLKAIADDGLTWTHVSDLKFWDSMVVPLYNISGIPYNVLLDANGRMVAQNLRGPELHQKLAEVLSGPSPAFPVGEGGGQPSAR